MTTVDAVALVVLLAVTTIGYLVTRRIKKEMLSLFDDITDNAKADAAKKGKKGLQP